MSPHKVHVLPSRAALSQYGISKNGFLPEEAPLRQLPHSYYHPWEHIIEKLPALVEKQQLRQEVDRLPVLTTEHLHTEAEWQRACSILALIAQGYIWTGPEPSQVSLEEKNKPKNTINVLTRIVATSAGHLCPVPGNLRAPRSESHSDLRHAKPVELESY